MNLIFQIVPTFKLYKIFYIDSSVGQKQCNFRKQVIIYTKKVNYNEETPMFTAINLLFSYYFRNV